MSGRILIEEFHLTVWISRDLPEVAPVADMYRTLNYKREPTFEAVATTGVGVFDTLKAVAKQILVELRKR